MNYLNIFNSSAEKSMATESFFEISESEIRCSHQEQRDLRRRWDQGIQKRGTYNTKLVSLEIL
jgi:hypothetical protein